MMLGDFIRKLGFTPTRADQNVWYKIEKDTMKLTYISTYVDDFMIISTNPEKYMKQFTDQFVVRHIEMDPTEYLGTQWSKTGSGQHFINMEKYIKESIRVLEKKHGTIREEKTPMISGSHPELDDSKLLDDNDKRKYQSCMGILTWINTSLRFDISYAVSSLSRFQTNPREGHMNAVMRIYGFLKKYPKRGIIIDHRPIEGQPEQEQVKIDFGQQYTDFEEELDPRFPPALMGEIEITVFGDSDHGRDQCTGISII